MASMLLATSHPEYTPSATYLDLKSEELLLEIICIFNLDILFLEGQFRSTVSQHNLKIFGNDSCCR